MAKKNEYDAVIIGAGISGLVCGCYLAKAGMKVLIVEKNAQPGGYCTSFTRQGFLFDACAHSLGSLREGEVLATILKDLMIFDRIAFHKSSPCDTVIAPDLRVSFYNDIGKTISEFSKCFKKESVKIGEFFEYINNLNGFAHVKLRKQTFKEFLDSYFYDERLKSIISIITLGNVGLPPSTLSAFTAVKLYRQFMLDGGYYPIGGMQKFPDILTQRFKELGGNFISLSVVTKILVENHRACGVILKSGEKVFSKYVVSACDAKQTFNDLISAESIDNKFLDKVNSLCPSISAFILYIGLDGTSEGLFPKGVNFWYLPDYDIEAVQKINEEGKSIDFNRQWFLGRFIPDSKSFILIANMPFKTASFWEKNRQSFSDGLINQVEKIIPTFKSHIRYVDSATPQTLYKWTLNYHGASYGWASLPEQFALEGLAQLTSLKNLYLAGHWTTVVQGIPGVAYIGKDTANIIIRRFKHEFK
jgi:prolycopene isomerase